MRIPTHDRFFGRLSSLSGGRSNVLGPEFGGFSNTDRRVNGLGDKETKIGATIVGIKTEEGIVLVTDMRVSMGYIVFLKDIQKAEKIHLMGTLTIAGSVSAAQSLISPLCAGVRLCETRHDEDASIQALLTLVSSFLRSGGFYVVQSVLDGADKTDPHIYSIDPTGPILGEKYTVTGFGSQYAPGMLEQGSEDGLSIEETGGVVTRAIHSTVERDLASGNGINIAVVTKDGADTQRHQNFESLEQVARSRRFLPISMIRDRRD